MPSKFVMVSNGAIAYTPPENNWLESIRKLKNDKNSTNELDGKYHMTRE